MIYLFFEGKNGEGHGPEAGQEAQQSCKEDTAWSAVNVTISHGRAGSRFMPLPAILPNETRLETFQRVYCHAQHRLYAVGCLVHAQPSGEIPERAQNMYTLSLNASRNSAPQVNKCIHLRRTMGNLPLDSSYTKLGIVSSKLEA